MRTGTLSSSSVFPSSGEGTWHAVSTQQINTEGVNECSYLPKPVLWAMRGNFPHVYCPLCASSEIVKGCKKKKKERIDNIGLISCLRKGSCKHGGRGMEILSDYLLDRREMGALCGYCSPPPRHYWWRLCGGKCTVALAKWKKKA